MSRWLVLPLVVLPYIATAASGAVPRDRDHDGLPDGWERRHHLSTSKRSATGDPDRDGLANKREYRLRTNPRKRDTDRDGLRDRAEVRRYHTNPRKKDTDGDGYSDGAEVRAGTYPLDRASHPSGNPATTPGNATTPPGGPKTTPTPTPAPPAPGFPDASNTGVPAGTVLTARSAPITIDTAGTVINGLEITAFSTSNVNAVTVNAPNVTIRNTRILGNGGFLIRSNSTGLLVEDSELVNIDSSNAPNCWAGIGFDGYTVRRSEIVGCENGVDPASNAVIEDSYIHDLDTVGPGWVLNPPHTDGVQMGDGAHDVVVRHNTIDPVAGSGGGTAAIIAYAAGDRVRIEDNFIDGGGSSYAIYAPRNPRTAWFINRNRMLPGVYGYTACVKVGTMVTELTENRDFGTHALLGPDNGVGGGCTN